MVGVRGDKKTRYERGVPQRACRIGNVPGLADTYPPGSRGRPDADLTVSVGRLQMPVGSCPAFKVGPMGARLH